MTDTSPDLNVTDRPAEPVADEAPAQVDDGLSPFASATDEAPQQARSGFSPFIWVIIMAVVGLLGVLGLQLLNVNQSQPDRGAAPDFTLQLFDPAAGEISDESITLSDYRGQVVVINFWASWCGPCRAEAPALQAVWERYQDSGEVLIVGVDYVDNTQDALGYIADFGITYPNGPDLGTRISDAYRIQGVPESFVVGRDGNIFQFIYAGISEADLTRIIEAALAQT